MKIQRNKVVIIGAGQVGSAVLSTLLTSGSLAEIVIIDKNEKKAYGEALDGSHSTAFAYSPNIKVKQGTYKDCEDASIIVITAGPSAQPGKPVDRIALAQQNIDVVKEVMEQVITYTMDAIIIMVSNPVDILTYYAQNYFGYPVEKIFGTGTTLDTARFRRILGQKYLIDTKNVHGYILGEHGETAFATWSSSNIAGVPIDDFDIIYDDVPLDKDAVVEEVKQVGYEILINKGYTNIGIAKSVDRIIRAILINELSVLPLSTTLTGEYGIEDVALSLPCIVTKDGIGRRLEVPLSLDETSKLRASAEFLRESFKNSYKGPGPKKE
jgi:L-lactate dehydrogenase